MTPWLRALRATGVGVVVVVWTGAAGALAPYGSVLAYGATYLPHAVAAPSASASAPAAEPSRAGSRAGEGRERPGRGEEAEEDLDVGVGGVPEEPGAGDATAVPEMPGEAVPVPSGPPQRPERQSVARAERPAEPVLRILPLGSGLVLIGLGLGLAFVGLRLRRA